MLRRGLSPTARYRAPSMNMPCIHSIFEHYTSCNRIFNALVTVQVYSDDAKAAKTQCDDLQL